MTEPTACCADRMMAVHAFSDGELDALASVELEEHFRSCAGCRRALDDVVQLRTMLADPVLRMQSPDLLRRRVERIAGPRPGSASTGRGRARDWLGGALGGAIAASIALWLAVPQLNAPSMAGLVIDGHVRSLQAGHLTDIAYSDRHVVKPWFNGRISFAPPVVDLRGQGFPMIGGRLDVLAGQDVAVLVYGRRRHVINLFVRPASAVSTAPALESENGYHLARWSADGLEFWAVSDVDGATLRAFRNAFRAGAVETGR